MSISVTEVWRPCWMVWVCRVKWDRVNDNLWLTMPMVEAKNGHIRTVFKFSAHQFHLQKAFFIAECYRIAGARINKYRNLPKMENASVDRESNDCQCHIKSRGLRQYFKVMSPMVNVMSWSATVSLYWFGRSVSFDF